ncbi:MAG: OmpA family protein [Bacteroidota bacterium]
MPKPWSVLFLCISGILSACVVSTDRFNDLAVRQDSLHRVLMMEHERNDFLQDYIDSVLVDNPRFQAQQVRELRLDPIPGRRIAPPVAPLDADLRQPVRFNHNFQELAQRLSGLQSNEIDFLADDHQLIFRLKNQLLFASGEVRLNERGKTSLRNIAEALKNRRDLTITVEGHTDNQELRPNDALRDNWDLSVRRATEVVRTLISFGIPPHLLVAAGRSKFDPLTSNQSPEGRAQNRRIEIILRPLPARQ